MTKDAEIVNSRAYWEARFSQDWDSAGGPEQTRFFAEVAIRLLPSWVMVDIGSCKSLVDVGCAEGEAAAYLKKRFPKVQVSGVDFSRKAVEVARERHADVDFFEGDVGTLGQRFDVVFCSNVLEHFHDPLEKLEKLIAVAKRYAIVLVPGWELDRHSEHHVTFNLSSFPRSIGDKHCIYAGAVNCGDINPNQWPGYQIMVVYAAPEVLSTANGTLADAFRDFQLNGLSVFDLEKLYAVDPSIGRLGELASLRRDTAEAESALSIRMQELGQRQELIGFHTRQEIADTVSKMEEGVIARLAEVEVSARQAAAAAGARLEEVVRERDEAQRTANRLADELEVQRRGQGEAQKDADEVRKQYKAVEQELSAASKEVRMQHAQLEAWQKYAAELNDDRKRLDADLKTVDKLLAQTLESTSWRLTGPLRWASERLLGRGSVPAVPDVKGLQEVYFPEVDLSGATAGSGALSPIVSGDLTWGEFSDWVLKNRDQYRGIFIQEMVIDWNVPLYQRPQHMATAFARIGYLVIYVTPQWGGDVVDGFRQISTNIWLTSNWEANTIPGAVRSIYSTAYAHTPELLAERPADSVMVYEYIDHIDPQISGEGEIIESLLKLKSWAFGGGVDLIAASARVLHAEAKSAVDPAKVVMVPNGVDTRHYRDPAQKSVALDPRLKDFCAAGRPIIGYFGAIAPWLWYEEIGELVASRSDLGFVFIGPDYHGGVQRLPQAENAIYLGPIDYKVLPAHAQLFDVCLIPFRPGEIARTTSPLKLFEYFALEKPVVVTSEMLECVAYPEVFRGETAEELSTAIDQALAVSESFEFGGRLRELADENDWDRRAEVLATAVEAAKRGKPATGSHKDVPGAN